METIWHRGSMHEKGLDLKKIHGDMLVTFGDNVPALSPIQLRLGGGGRTEGKSWRWPKIYNCHHGSKAHQTDHITRKSDIDLGGFGWFLRTFLKPGWVLASSLWAKNKETIYADNHHPSATLKKAKGVTYKGKGMVSVFFHAEGIMFIYWNAIVLVDYLQKSYTINGKYFTHILKQFRNAIKVKSPGKLTKGVMFH